ncbi:M23 family metallopeptidase [Gaetbulibacter sp. M240]|uniref:M23 family metallopeptidase n=1 Tax=Gaetbulibacter sp. M240 TaxID=3126511 RepID=UPI00374F5E37
MNRVFVIILLFITISCNTTRLPSEKFSQYEYFKSYSIENGKLKIEIQNPLNCPLRVWMFNNDVELQNRFNRVNPIELKSKSDTIIIFSEVKKIKNEITFSSRLGSLSKKIEQIKLELPFPINKEYKIIQGNNTNYTHSSDWSRYALDFDLKIKDTICSATNGFIVGVVDKYKFGGKGDKWKLYGNYVTIYEPKSGLFTQYVHLVKNGSLVKVGDEVVSGQPIALSGRTGQTDIEHLHFSCLIPVNRNEGLKSIPFEFKEGYKSTELKKNDIVRK